MLLLINIKDYEPRKVVQYFEVVKEKAPELILSFDQLLVIGRAYRDINEYERAIIVWRGLIEASYLEDARVGELLRQRGKTLEAMTYLIDLWRTYPNTPSIESDFFGLSQVLAQAASNAFTDPSLRRELAAAGVTRSDLLLQSIRMIQIFLSQSSTNPMADEASLALVGAFLELENYESVVKLAGRFARLYPKSTFLDSFQYSEALANFHLGRYDRAVEVAEKIARSVYKDAGGADQPSPNKWQALYILGQIFDARRVPGKALEYYRQVADRFTDASSAIQFYTRKEMKVPEVSVVRPLIKPAVAQGRRSRSTGCSWRPGRTAGGRRSAASREPCRWSGSAGQAGHQARVSQYRKGGCHGLPRRPDAALSHSPQPERDCRHRPGRHYPPGREERRPGGRLGLRRPFPDDRPAARQGGCIPGHDPGR